VFKKLSVRCQKQRRKTDAELFPTKFGYLYGADALKTVRLPERENQSDEADLHLTHSRANTVESVQSMDLEIQPDTTPVTPSQSQEKESVI
jgi:hypothetical protein